MILVGYAQCLRKEGQKLTRKAKCLVFHADIQAVLRTIGHRYPPEVGRCSCKDWRPLPITQPARCEIKREEDGDRQGHRTSSEISWGSKGEAP